MDLLLDAQSHDAIFHNGTLTTEFTTQPFTQVVGQRLKIRLLSFKSEWFLDTEYGVPWWDILGHKISKSSLDRTLQEQILSENGVKEITSFNSTFQNRRYSATFRVRVSTGEVSETININPVS